MRLKFPRFSRWRFSLILLTVFFVQCWGVFGARFGVGASSQEGSTPLYEVRQKIAYFDENAPSISEMLHRVSQKYGVRFGVDLGDKSPSHPISVHVAQGTVADLLDAIIAKAPGYKWANVEGVVNVTPEKGSNALLDLTIDHFQVKNATPIYIQRAICSLPEVKLWLEQSHLVERTLFGGIISIGENGVTNEPRVSLSLHNMTLRAIMNRIVRSPGFAGWLVGRYGDHNQFFMISVD